MPITFIDVERQKSLRIVLLLFLLVAFYFIFAFIVAQAVVLFMFRADSFFVFGSLKYAAIIAVFVLTLAVVHFSISGYTAVQRVIEQVRAGDPDPEDGIHRQLVNIIEEIHVASGNVRKIRCMVIPTLSMNALAVTDLRGEAVIAITEGLLSRLSRDQLEAVVAHEAYHILSGDCLETSIAASLFGIYASAVEGLKGVSEEDFRAVPFLFLFWVLSTLGSLVTMFISREREYRADAGAVRMTRNPLALAEALHRISARWSGTGFISDGLEMLCISSPTIDAHDESEGWLDDLLSTHPPVRKRIAVLLGMAHVSASVLDSQDRSRTAVQMPGSPASSVYGGSAQEPVVVCPSCRGQLTRESSESTVVFRCRSCMGLLVDNDKIPRILARKQVTCTDRLLALVRAVTADNQRSLAIRQKRLKEKKNEETILCPKCNRVMFRTFYSYAYLIEIDRCSVCHVTWFDTDELEMLQCLIENKIAGTIGIASDVQDV
ncbi:MAG: M48 family metalloprotease [Nitrospirae bacterium]|nr:M48 family metalloprotease [Nitrospirota bacterium]